MVVRLLDGSWWCLGDGFVSLGCWVTMMGFYLFNLLGLLGNDGGFGSWLCHGLRLVVPVD